MDAVDDLPGPELPSSSSADAAVQLHQTGHSSIVQHFQVASGSSADFATLRCV